MTTEQLIISMQPFSNELKSWCASHPEFLKALKIIYPHRFLTLQALVTSYSPNYPDDEVIGIYIYDFSTKIPKFKQDFIVNKGKTNNKFILYTRYSPQSKFIKYINEFFET